MKKNSFLKIIGIIFLVTMLLSWIIPAGNIATGDFVELNSTYTLGLFDLLRVPALSIATFIQYGLLFLAIGLFYGVFAKTGAYTSIVEALEKMFKKDKNLNVYITIIFIVLSALSGLTNVLLILVPLFVAVLLKSGKSKLTAFASTIGAILVGQIGSVLASTVWGYFMYFYEMELGTEILVRTIILVVSTVLYIFAIKSNEKKYKEEVKTKEIPLYDNEKTKKNAIPALIILVLSFLLLVVGTYNWVLSFELEIFTELHTNIMEFEVGGMTLFANLLGSINELGTWGNYEIVCILALGAIIIGWLYNLKTKDIYEGMVEGARKMLPAALYACLASVIFTVILIMQSNGSSMNFVNTIIFEITGNGDMNVFSIAFSTILGSLYYNDFYTFVSEVVAIYGNTSNLPLTLIIVQVVNGIVMLVAPVSVFLIGGLKYMEIEYSSWIKYIWKFALMILGFILVVGLIMMVI